MLAELAGGRKLALVSDAGTPCVNDPGQILVRACVEKGVEFCVIPGACSVIQALVMSGMEYGTVSVCGVFARRSRRRC